MSPWQRGYKLAGHQFRSLLVLTLSTAVSVKTGHKLGDSESGGTLLTGHSWRGPGFMGLRGIRVCSRIYGMAWSFSLTIHGWYWKCDETWWDV